MKTIFGARSGPPTNAMSSAGSTGTKSHIKIASGESKAAALNFIDFEQAFMGAPVVATSA